MELEDLKQTWEKTIIKKNKNTDIMDIMKHKSYGPIAALKREFRKQIIVMALLPLFLLITTIDDISKIYTNVLFWSYVAFCSGMIIFCLYELSDSRKNGKDGWKGTFQSGAANRSFGNEIKMEAYWFACHTPVFYCIGRNSSPFSALPHAR